MVFPLAAFENTTRAMARKMVVAAREPVASSTNWAKGSLGKSALSRRRWRGDVSVPEIGAEQPVRIGNAE